jgi:hypothetical protein
LERDNADLLWSGVTLRDYRGHPYPSDGVKQSLATAQGSVTALTESSVNCAVGPSDTTGNQHCAFPLGYKTDTIVKNLGICVKVDGAKDKWVEIMGASMDGSGGASYCVRDRNAGANLDGETGCTVSGDLIDIRASDNRPIANNINLNQMSVIFYAQDNTDDAAIDFQWRITASYIPSTNQEDPMDERDAEDWSMSRDGAGYPSMLQAPYPQNYNGTAVFESSVGSSASWSAPLAQLVIALVAMTALLV